MREVFERLERLGIRYFVTGSEAASLYGSIRQTFDTDVVVDLQLARFGVIVGEFEDAFVVNDPIEYEEFAMASLVDIATAAKIDLIMRQAGPWSQSAMSRRRKADHPDFGTIWVSSVEDLILAKLMWSEGKSELQLRDCGVLVRINRDTIDWAYTERWAMALDVSELLRQVRDAA